MDHEAEKAQAEKVALVKEFAGKYANAVVKCGAERGRIARADGVLIVVDCNWQPGYYRRVKANDIFFDEFEEPIDGYFGFTDWCAKRQTVEAPGDEHFVIDFGGRADWCLKHTMQPTSVTFQAQPAPTDTWPAWAERQNEATPPLHVAKTSISSTSRRALQDACTFALNLLRDLPTRSLDAPMRVRVLEVERALVEALRPESDADVRGSEGKGDARGSACARMVAAYDD